MYTNNLNGFQHHFLDSVCPGERILVPWPGYLFYFSWSCLRSSVWNVWRNGRFLWISPTIALTSISIFRNSSTANINLDSELPGAEVRLLSKLFICMYWKSIPNCLTAIVFKVTKIPLSWRVALAQSEAKIKVTWSFSTNQRPVSRSLDHSRPRQYGTFHFWILP